jgi:hypothetical protein
MIFPLHLFLLPYVFCLTQYTNNFFQVISYFNHIKQLFVILEFIFWFLIFPSGKNFIGMETKVIL